MLHENPESVDECIMELSFNRLPDRYTYTCSRNKKWNTCVTATHQKAIYDVHEPSKQRFTCRLQLYIILLLITFNEPIACCSYQYVRLNRRHKSLCSRILWLGRIMRHYLYTSRSGIHLESTNLWKTKHPFYFFDIKTPSFIVCAGNI